MDERKKDFPSYASTQGFVPAGRRESSVDPMWHDRQRETSVEPDALQLERKRREAPLQQCKESLRQ